MARSTGRPCAAPDCRRKALRKHLYCETCSTLCSRCRAAPKAAAGAYCQGCGSLYRREYYDRTQTAHRPTDTLRCRANRQIRLGRLQRLPCAICNREPSFCYFPNMTLETVTFLCREHHDEVTDRHGRQAKARRALKEGDSQ